jgi:hypothetical protein
MTWTLNVEAPMNGRLRRATVRALLDGQEKWTDKVDIEDAKERSQLAEELARRTGIPVDDVGQLLMDGLAAARRRRQEQAAEGDEETGSTQSQVLLALADGAELFHSPEGDPFATVKVSDHAETWPLRSRGFRRWLAGEFFAQQGKAPGGQALQDALTALEGKAVFAGAEHPVYVRVAEHQGRIYLDLADDAWRAVEVDALGWRVVEAPPVRFRRPKGLLALPEPVRGGRLDELRPFLNLAGGDAGDARDAAWYLLAGWLTSALRPGRPYPLLVLNGEQGTAKSTLGRLLRSLIDPSVAPLRSEPREVRDLMIAATSGWLVALDNLSHLPQWLSDSLCRLSTGGGFATRELYTDAEEVLFDAQRPALLTSIEEVVTSGDLLDRSLFLRLDPIPDEKRRTEAELWSAWETVRPRVLCGLLDAVSAGLRQLPSVHLGHLPRMADFALWLEAVGRGLGWKPGVVLAAYRGVIGDAAGLALEASPVAGPLLELAGQSSPWQGTASELLDRLTTLAGEKAKGRGWPGKPHLLSGHLRRLSPNLRRVGVLVTFDRLSGGSRTRTVKLERTGPGASPASRASHDGDFPEETAENGGTLRDAGGTLRDAERDAEDLRFSNEGTQGDARDAPAHSHSDEAADCPFPG